jgi:hypothetical protein
MAAAALAQQAAPTATVAAPTATVAAPTATIVAPTPTVAITATAPVAGVLPIVEADDDEIGEADEARPATQEAGTVELTVYNQDLGLVKEVRTIELAEGANEVRYTDVASRIDPTSVHFVSLTDPAGTTVLEQNYEYDLVSSQKLLQRYVDREISLTAQDGTVYTGMLLSGADDVILDTGEGIIVVRLDQVQEFSFPRLPEGLITRPTLVWLLQAAAPGAQDVRVTYLTSGISWRADYIAMLAPDDASIALNGWVTVDNRSGATYRDARLKLVAGDIHRAPRNEMMEDARVYAAPMPMASPQVEQRDFFEYHVYEVARPVTVADRQTKQIEFVSAPEVAVEKVYVFEASPRFYPSSRPITDAGYGAQGETKVQVRLELTNSQEAGLGVPLPMGVVRVYKEDAGGGAELVGEDAIDHTPRNERLSLTLGNAFDLVGERVQTGFRTLGERSVEESYEITLRNQKENEAVTIRVIENLFRWREAEVTESTPNFTQVDASTIRFDVRIAAGGEAVVRYTVRYRW